MPHNARSPIPSSVPGGRRSAARTRRLWAARRAGLALALAALMLAGCSFGQGSASSALSAQPAEAAQPAGASQPAQATGPAAEVTPASRPQPIATNAPLDVTSEPLRITTEPLRITTERAELGASPALYSGNVVAEDKVDVLAEVAGRVLVLNVEVGDVVHKDDVLLEQDTAMLEARQAQALAGLEAAAAQLELLTEPASESDLEAARASISAAEAAYQRAVDGPTEEELRAAEAQLRQAEAVVTQAQAAYNLVSWRTDVGALPQSLALEQATLQVEAARAQYDKLVKGATADVIAGAYAQISAARARLATLEQGAKEGQIHAAQAQARQAETALYLATLELDKATVRAPMDGVVAAVNTEVGAQAGAGLRVATIQSHAVKVEIAVEEAQIAMLQVGLPAEIRVNAFPDRVFPGTVSIVAPALDPSTRTVMVTVRPTGDAEGLRPGMFATVAFGQ